MHFWLSGEQLFAVGNVQLARTQRGEKSAFTIRHFPHYRFTEETPMIAERSPIAIDDKCSDTFDKNVLKFIPDGRGRR